MAHTRQADWEPGAAGLAAMWSVWRPDAEGAVWIPSEPVKVGDKRTYDGKLYECISAHTTQKDWTPVLTLDVLWKAVVVVPPGDKWVDSGVKVTSLMGAGVIGVTDTKPFTAAQRIRIKATEATVTRIHAAGAPGILVIAPNIMVSGGEVIEVLSP